MGLFWPESTQDQARHALRQALHILRHELGEDAIVTRGEGDVTLNREIVSVDAVSFERAIHAADYRAALDLYGGEFLQGYFISGVPEFERWLDDERTRLRELAAEAAWALAHERIAASRLVEAERTAQRALLLVATDESEVRRFIKALAGAGDRAAAVRFCEKFAQRIKDQYELEPAPETIECLESLRSRPGRAIGKVATTVADSPTAASLGLSARPPAAKRLVPAAILAALSVGAVTAVLLLSGGGRPLYPDRVAVAPFENRGGDSAHDEIGQWALDWISNGIKNEGILEVVPAGVSRRIAESGGESLTPYLDLARATHSGLVVIGWYYVDHDSLHIHCEVVDARDGSLLYSLSPVSGLVESALDPIETVRSSVLGILARHVDPDWPGNPTLYPPPPSVEVYRETMAGLRSHVRQDYEQAVGHYQRALALDSTFFEALKGLATSLNNVGRLIERDSVTELVERNRRKLTPFQRAVLDRELGWIRGDLDLEFKGAQEMARLDPLGHAFDVAYTALRANHPRQAVEHLTRREYPTDVQAQWFGYWTVLTQALHLLGEHGEELQVARQAREAHPGQDWSYQAEICALVGLGRIDEACRMLDSLPLLQLRSTRYRNPRSIWQTAAAELRTHGYAEAANEYYSRLIRYYEGRLAEDSTRDWRPPLANALYHSGRYAEAYSVLAELHAEHPESIGHWGNMGASAAHLGRREEALLISDSIARWNLKYVQGRKSYFRARISAILGDHAGAVDLLRDAAVNGVGYDFHTSEVSIILRDYPPFQNLMRPKG
jgi:DNA-binding SARP family transcriptional activator